MILNRDHAQIEDSFLRFKNLPLLCLGGLKHNR